jgi:hypothetical protein
MLYSLLQQYIITAGATTTARGLSLTAERAAAPEVAAGAPRNGRRGVSPAQPACECAARGEPKSVPVRMRGRGVLEYGVLERVPLPAVPYSGALLAHGVAAAAVRTGTHGVLTGTHGYSRVLYWPAGQPPIGHLSAPAELRPGGVRSFR